MSENCLGRAQVLAEVLAAFGEVRILGPKLSRELWPPALSSKIEMASLDMGSAWSYPRGARWLRRELGGSRVVVSKPRSTSLGLTLLAGVSPNDLLLDIDDWDLGFMKPSAGSAVAQTRALSLRALALLDPRSLNSYFMIRLLDAQVRRFPHRVVSNSWLQRRFGGVLLPHVRDAVALDPGLFVEQGRAMRAQAGMDERAWIGFIGTIREHKGVEDLVSAVAALTGARAPGLLLAGVDFEHSLSKQIIAEAASSIPPERLHVVGTFKGADLPSWLMAADVICIPNRDVRGAWGQIPAKLFDAMTMARAIVASDVNDIAEILSGCGLLFPGGDIGALTRALQTLTGDAALRARYGAAARARASERFSLESGRSAMAESIGSLPVFEPKR